TAIVLGETGGALSPLVLLAKVGLGGKQGNGDQFFSWVHVQDFVRALDFIQEHSEIVGTINIAAPNPVKNRLVMKILRNALRIPFGIPAPKWLLKIGAVLIKTETELILKSRNVIPGKLNKLSFEFNFPTLAQAIQNLV
ncbi:MAG: NAD dependent epimerase/dehydratase family enzyme, partial [Flavobacteriales bacterium]